MDALTTVRFRIATTLSALTCVAALGCTSTQPPADGEDTKDAKVDGRKAPETKTPEAKTIPEPEPDFPPCPSGEWCGDAEAAKLLTAKNDVAAGESLGCPTRLEDPSDPEQAKKLVTNERLEGFPFSGGAVYATLDENATKAVRSDPASESTCCYQWNEMCPGGRPLLVGHEPITAELDRGGGWSEAIAVGSVPVAVRRALARGWLEDALAEHASVASFARFTLELMALGAPPELLAAAQRAGLEEVGHAQACFSIAAELGARRSPGPLPIASTRATSFAQLAHDTFVEGCVGETIAALLAERMARSCQVPAVKAVWERIAREEAAHAALAWATLAWASSRDPQGVQASVQRAVESLRPWDGESCPDADERLLALGRPDPATQWHVRREAWAYLIDGELRRRALG